MLGIRHPIIGGAMYPCSNPELVAAISTTEPGSMADALAYGQAIVNQLSLDFDDDDDGCENYRELCGSGCP